MQASQEDLPIPPPGWEATEESPLKTRCHELADEIKSLGFDISSLSGSSFQIISPADDIHSDVLIESLVEYLSREVPSGEFSKIKDKIAAMKEHDVLVLINEPGDRNLILENSQDRWLLSYGITRQYMQKVKHNLGVYKVFSQISSRIVKGMQHRE